MPIREENQTLATITLQNYFRMYDVLAGMTGTAKTEEDEFRQIYGLEVVQIPTNAPMVRLDENDFIFTTAKEKYAAVVEDIVERYEKGQPVLVGTVSVEVSEMLSRLLERHGVEHNVLNAKQHEREAHIIENAGQKGAITIATNMAGRGVDIKLGEGVIEAGGLYVLGTERHESRRIDNQLRGRSGRQGDPGESRFYLSAEDELIRLFAGDRMFSILSRLGPAGGPADRGQDAEQRGREGAGQGRGAQLHAPQERAQVRRGHERAAPRHLRPAAAHPHGRGLRRAGARDGRRAGRGRRARRARGHAVLRGLGPRLAVHRPQADLHAGASRSRTSTSRAATVDEVVDLAVDDALEQYDERERLIGAEQMRDVERAVMLQVIDGRWKEHLLDMDYLQEGIHLRALGQRDPLVEYKSEGFDLFNDMLESVKTSTVTTLMKNRPEDLAMFTAITLDEPVVALNYTSGDDLINQTSFTGAAMAAGEYPADDGLADGPLPNVAAGRRGAAATTSTGAGRRCSSGSSYDKVGTQRPVPVREREEVQEVSWGLSRPRLGPPSPCAASAARSPGGRRT